jgi:hypothetical protein
MEEASAHHQDEERELAEQRHRLATVQGKEDTGEHQASSRGFY